MHAARSIAVLAAFAGAAFPAVANQICLYVDKTGLTGHGFVQMLPSVGPQAGRTDLVYGKYPAGADIFGGAGIIKWDKSHRWSQKVCWNVTPAQFNAAARKVNTKIAAPTAYHLLRANCVDWAENVVRAGGKVPPPSRWWGIPDPKTLAANIKAVGNGGVINGGRITYNAAPNTAPDGKPVAAVMPRDISVSDITAVCANDPVQGAAMTGLALNQQVFPVVRTHAGEEYVVSAQVDLNENLAYIDWGDGSGPEAQQAPFAHSYAAPGSYAVTLVVINSGMINHYSWQVDATSGDAPAATECTFPEPPTPGDFPNPGFEDPTLPRELYDGCPADFNGSGKDDFFDYLDFIELFAQEDAVCDVNGDEMVDFADYLDFAAAFAEGCN